MTTIPFPFLVAWSIGTILALAGLMNIAGPRGLRAAYARWEFPTRFHLAVGVLQIAAGIFLAIPDMRVWGIALAGFIIFGAVVTLFNHRRYVFAVPAIMLMAALIPASLAIPHQSHLHYVNILPAG
jgi:hypothetical protein